jgi:hypothetical protein
VSWGASKYLEFYPKESSDKRSNDSEDEHMNLRSKSKSIDNINEVTPELGKESNKRYSNLVVSKEYEKPLKDDSKEESLKSNN